MNGFAATKVAAVWGLLLLASFGFMQKSFRDLANGGERFVPSPPEFVGLSLDPRLVRRLLGVRLLVADFIWIDTLIKADTSREQRQFSPFYRSFKSIVALDPDNIYAYYVAGMYLSVIKDDVKGATAILTEGARYLDAAEFRGPGAWSVYFALGYNLLFEEQDVDAARPWLLKAGEFPDAPNYVRWNSRKFSTEQGALEAGSRALADFYKRVKTLEERQGIEKKMLELAARQDLLDLNEKFQRFLSATGAYALPKSRQLQLFMRSAGHGSTDMLGRPLGLNAVGKIAPIRSR